MKNILKLKRKISVRLIDRDGGLYLESPADAEFSALWSKLFNGHLIQLDQDVRPVIENGVMGMKVILSELHKSGPVVLDVGDELTSFELTVFPQGNIVAFGIFENTGLRSLHRQVQLQRDAMELIDHAHPGALFQVKRNADKQMSLDFASPRFAEIMELPALTVESFIAGLDDQTHTELFNAFRFNNNEDIFFEGKIESPNRRYWQIRASILSQQDGITTFLGVLENNTERKQQLEHIKYTSDFLNSITQNIPIGIAVSNIPQKKYLYVNQELCNLTGYSEENFLIGGFAFWREKILLYNKDNLYQNLDEIYGYYNNNPSKSNTPLKLNITIKASDNSERHLFLLVKPLGGIGADNKYDTFIHMFEDVTAKIEFENKKRKDEILLVQSNKMAELGEMASCIAHEINNPLSIIGHLLENIEARYQDDQDIALSFQTLDRISKIVKALIGFARDAGSEGPGQKPVPLSEIIDDTLLLCHNKLTNKKIDFKVSGDLNACPHINDTLLSQVLLNLINNSYDILENESGDRWLKLEAKVIRSALSITFTDSGQAPDVEIMQSWFEPFYTSKEKGKGTGLGLSICQNLLRSAGGAIRPIINKNTSFQISLPLWPKNSATEST